jgi:hypothetical protein
MLDSQSSHSMQNYDAASFSGGRPGATPSRMLDIGVDTLAGSLPDIAHSQFWPGFNADISTGSFAGGIVSQFEPGLKHGDSIGCHPAGNFETPPSRQGVWDGLDHASGEEHTMRYAGELRSDQAIDENTGANYYLLGCRCYSLRSRFISCIFCHPESFARDCCPLARLIHLSRPLLGDR